MYFSSSCVELRHGCLVLPICRVLTGSTAFASGPPGHPEARERGVVPGRECTFATLREVLSNTDVELRASRMGSGSLSSFTI